MKTRIKYKLRAPVSHIGETASTGSYFQTVLTSGGKVPVITGNSIRGQIRDCIAADLLDRLGCVVGKEAFHVLFSGGNINGTMREDVEKARLVRAHFPGVSLLGGGLGDMILSGKLIAGFAYPVCVETEFITGEPGEFSWRNLIDEIEFTRTDDSKNDRVALFMDGAEEELTAKASTQMRFSVQYIAAGTEFVQDILFLDGVTDLEIGAFYAGVLKWFPRPRLGGMAAKGFGLFDAVVGENDIVLTRGEAVISDPVHMFVEDYHDFVSSEGTDWLYLLQSKGGSKKNVKKTGATD